MSKSIRWTVICGSALVAIVSVAELAVCVHTFRQELHSFQITRVSSNTATASRTFPQLAEFSLQTPFGHVVCWYIPGTRRSAIIVEHGYGGARQEMLPEITILNRHGFGVLAFDWPGQGQSPGKITLSAPERAAVMSGIDWLLHRGDVDEGRIGAFGFSTGGYLVGQAALVDRRIRALAIAATMPSFSSFTDAAYERRGFLAQWSARYADKKYGLDLGELVLVDRIHELTCPILVIAGGKDPIVPSSMAVLNYINAREPKEYFLIPNAHHGDYAETAPESYPERLVRFFERALEH